MEQRYKRRKLLVDTPYQIRMILRFTGVVVYASFVIGILVFLFTQTSTTVAIEKTRVFVKPTSDFILPILVLTVLSVAFIAGTVVMLMALFISHRIVGPVYRLKMEIEALRQGHIKRNFSTREKDHLKDLSKCLQDMSDALAGRHNQIKQNYEALAAFLKNEKASLSPDAQEKLKVILSEFKDNVDYFKT